MLRIFTLIAFGLALFGCTAIPPERLAQPVIDVNTVQDKALRKAMWEFEEGTSKRVAKRIYGFQGYPSWAVAHKLEGDVEVKVTSYGGRFKTEIVAADGDPIFKEYALAYVGHEVYKVYMDDKLRDLNFSFTVVAAFHL